MTFRSRKSEKASSCKTSSDNPLFKMTMPLAIATSQNMLSSNALATIQMKQSWLFLLGDRIIIRFNSLFLSTGHEGYRSGVGVFVFRPVCFTSWTPCNRVWVTAPWQRDTWTNGICGAWFILLSDDSGSSGSTHSRPGTLVLHLLRLLWKSRPERRQRWPRTARYKLHCIFLHILCLLSSKVLLTASVTHRSFW